MAEQAGLTVWETATCKHCHQPITRRRQPRTWWTHTGNRRERCAPGSPRNAQLADPEPDSVVRRP